MIVQSQKARLYILAALVAVALVAILLAGLIGIGNAHLMVAALFAGFIILLRINLQIFEHNRDSKLIELS